MLLACRCRACCWLASTQSCWQREKGNGLHLHTYKIETDDCRVIYLLFLLFFFLWFLAKFSIFFSFSFCRFAFIPFDYFLFPSASLLHTFGLPFFIISHYFRPSSGNSLYSDRLRILHVLPTTNIGISFSIEADSITHRHNPTLLYIDGCVCVCIGNIPTAKTLDRTQNERVTREKKRWKRDVLLFHANMSGRK